MVNHLLSSDDIELHNSGYQDNKKQFVASQNKVINMYLERDLKLDLIIDIMANGDDYLKDVCSKTLLSPIDHLPELLQRQEIIQEAIKNSDLFTNIYQIGKKVLDKIASYDDVTKPKYDSMVPVYKKITTYHEISNIYITALENIRNEFLHGKQVESKACRKFIQEFTEIYSSQFILTAKQQLKSLQTFKENSSIQLGAHYGTGMKLSDVVLHDIGQITHTTVKSPIFSTALKKNIIKLEDNILSNNKQEMLDAGLYWVLKTLVQYTNKMRSIMEDCIRQFGFYTGVVRLFHKLKTASAPITFPTFSIDGLIEFEDLIDMGLVLKNEAAKPNNIKALDKKLWIITGANQGGKTTFLRSVGLAQIMAQAGLFVSAKSYHCNLFDHIFTHFPDEEDQVLMSGLLDKELKKMDMIIDKITPNSLILMNESFATTTEFDACYLAEEIITSFCECNITTVFVTHNYKYAHGVFEQQQEDAIFLRAQLLSSGERNYKIMEGEPLKSSQAIDLYEKIMNH